MALLNAYVANEVHQRVEASVSIDTLELYPSINSSIVVLLPQYLIFLCLDGVTLESVFLIVRHAIFLFCWSILKLKISY